MFYRFLSFEVNVLVFQGIDLDFEFGLRCRAGLYQDPLIQGVFSFSGNQFPGAGSSSCDLCPGLVDIFGLKSNPGSELEVRNVVLTPKAKLRGASLVKIRDLYSKFVAAPQIWKRRLPGY